MDWLVATAALHSSGDCHTASVTDTLLGCSIAAAAPGCLPAVLLLVPPAYWRLSGWQLQKLARRLQRLTLRQLCHLGA